MEGRSTILLRERGRFTPDEALAVLDPVCAALGAAHAAGVVHRDVKASNIAFHGPTRTVKLLDFGIAKLLSPLEGEEGLTTVGRQVGTPTIMAPEQLNGGPVDARVDVYALGVLLYRLLTGRTPFEAHSPAGLARKHMEEPPPRPSVLTPVSPAVDAVVLRCLEKRPQRRFDSTAGLVAALADAVGRPAGRVLPVSGAAAQGVAIYVEVRTQTVGDDLDDGLGRDLQFVLDRIEVRLAQGGFILTQATSTGILGVQLFGEEGGFRERRAAESDRRRARPPRRARRPPHARSTRSRQHPRSCRRGADPDRAGALRAPGDHRWGPPPYLRPGVRGAGRGYHHHGGCDTGTLRIRRRDDPGGAIRPVFVVFSRGAPPAPGTRRRGPPRWRRDPARTRPPGSPPAAPRAAAPARTPARRAGAIRRA